MQTPAGKASYQRLAGLELPRNPSKYIPSRRNVDQQGRVYLELANRAPVAVANVQVAFRYLDSAGRQRDEQRTYRNRIQPGKNAIIVLGTQYAPLINQMQVKVVGAQPLQ